VRISLGDFLNKKYNLIKHQHRAQKHYHRLILNQLLYFINHFNLQIELLKENEIFDERYIFLICFPASFLMGYHTKGVESIHQVESLNQAGEIATNVYNTMRDTSKSLQTTAST